MQLRRTFIVGCLAGLAVSTAAEPAKCQLWLGDSRIASDGTVYQVVSVYNGPLLLGVDELQVTTVAAGSTAEACSTVGAPGSLAAAAVTVPSLFRFADVRRTGVLTPNDASVVNFDPFRSGKLTLGSGCQAIEVCLDPQRCFGGAGDALIGGLDTADATVPAACIADEVRAACSSASGQAWGFGLPADEGHRCLTAPTTDTATCSERPADGFTMGRGQAIVFIYPALRSLAFGAGGFGIEAVGDDSRCPVDSVVTADAQYPPFLEPGADHLDLGTATGQRGETVRVAINVLNFPYGTSGVRTTSNDIIYDDTALRARGCTVSSSAAAAPYNRSAVAVTQHCTDASAACFERYGNTCSEPNRCNRLRFETTASPGQYFPNGAIAFCDFEILPEAQPGTYTLKNIASVPNTPVLHADGSIVVLDGPVLPAPTPACIDQPTPTPTAPSSSTPTYSPTSEPTATPTLPPPTASNTPASSVTPKPCAGDCFGDGAVTVDEIIQMVNIAVGEAAVSACRAGDADNSGEITVDEVVAAVANSLSTCA